MQDSSFPAGSVPEVQSPARGGYLYRRVAEPEDRIVYKGGIIYVDPGDAIPAIADADIGIWKSLDEFEPSSPSKLLPVFDQWKLAVITTRGEDNQARFKIVGRMISKNLPWHDGQPIHLTKPRELEENGLPSYCPNDLGKRGMFRACSRTAKQARICACLLFH